MKDLTPLVPVPVRENVAALLKMAKELISGDAVAELTYEFNKANLLEALKTFSQPDSEIQSFKAYTETMLTAGERIKKGRSRVAKRELANKMLVFAATNLFLIEAQGGE